MSEQQNMNNVNMDNNMDNNDDTELISQVLNEMNAEDEKNSPNPTMEQNNMPVMEQNNMDYQNSMEPEEYNEHYIDNNENNEQYYDEEEIDNDFEELPEIKRSFLENLMYELKEPFLIFILYAVLSNPLINGFVNKTFPVFKSNNLYRYLLLFIKALLLSTLFYVFKKFML